MYAVDYGVIRNVSLLQELEPVEKPETYIIYQGAVNEGRSFETLIPAFKKVDCKLLICGDGNFMKQTRDLVTKHQLQDKVIFKGRVKPEELQKITRHAFMGITLFEEKGLSNYYSLANRFSITCTPAYRSFV